MTNLIYLSSDLCHINAEEIHQQKQHFQVSLNECPFCSSEKTEEIDTMWLQEEEYLSK